jgi:protein O-mannosyl-transferase
MAKKHTPATQGNTMPKSTPQPAPTTPVEWYPYALAVAAFLLYSFGFNNPMVAMDDHTATINNPAVKDFAFFKHFNLGMFAPVTWFFYGIAYKMNGGTDKATLYHVISAVVHAANVVLVYRLFRKWSAPVLMAGLVAGLFAVHPLNVEAVSWIAGLSTPLYVMFSLMALSRWTNHVNGGTSWGKHYWWALGAFVLACLAKSAAVMLPLTLLVLDIWWKRPLLRHVSEKVLFFGVSIGFGALTLVSRVHEGQITKVDSIYTTFERFFMACHSILFYWAKFLVPTSLSIWYPFEKAAGGTLGTAYFVAPVALVGLLALAFWKRKEWPLLWAGVLFYLANIVLALPFSTMGTFELRSDRYNYMAMLGLLAPLAYLPVFVKEKYPAFGQIALAAVGIVGLVWAGLAVQRIGDWKDTMTLLNKSLERYGDNFGRAYYWRGMEIGDRVRGPKEAQRAIDDFSKALEINPELTECYKYRGAFYGLTKQYDKSVSDLTEYLKTKPNDAEYRFNRGLSYLNLGRHQDAVADMDQTLKDNPGFYEAYLTRSNAFTALGDTVRAQADMRRYEEMARKGKRR